MDTNNDVKKKQPMKQPKLYESLHVTPLVEIFNISVNGNENDEFGVYGSIKVTDRGHTFSIYKQTEDSPQFMVSGNKLLLTVEDELDNAVIIPSEHVILNVNLFAFSGHDKITLQGKITLNRTTDLDDWSEEYKTETVADNKNWNVEVQYAIFPYAVAATVRVMHFSKDDNFDPCVVPSSSCVVPPDDDDDDFYEDYESEDEQDVTDYNKNTCPDITKLYGSVSAFAAVCGNNGQRSTLFSKGVQDSVQVQSGRYIELSRSVVAVPAYSSLKIEASFFDGNASPIADDTVEFKPVFHWIPYKKDIAMGNGNGRIRVQVAWSSAYCQLYRNNPSDMWDPTTLYSRDDDLFKKQRVMSDQLVVSKRPSSATLNDDCSLPEHSSSETYSSNCVLPSSTYTEPLLELFSVVVCSKDSKHFKFCGEIYFADAGWPNHVLERHESCPLDCPTSGMSVILKGPQQHESLTLLRDFALVVNIRDASSQAAISCGLIAFRRLDRELLANRRICSVIRGEEGFAVVHYSIFPEGVSAIVDIKLSGKCLPGMIIKGEICAVYDNCEPGRCYQDKYFKNFLFYDYDDGVRLNDSTHTLPLLKPLLSLPIKSILSIEANLVVSTVDGSLAEGPGEPLKGNIKFLNNEKSSQQIGNGDLCLDVSVHFTCPL